MKKIILFLLLSVSVFGQLNLKIIYSDPEEGKEIREAAIERAKTFDSEEFERYLKADIKGDKVTEHKSSEKIEHVVYVTKSGKKYHRESCRYNKNATAISIDQARGRGLEACKVCKP